MKSRKYEKISDRQLQNINEAYNKCTGCRACMKQCPMLETYCKSPKILLETLASGDYFTGIKTKQAYIDNLKMPFTCTLCGYCDQVCPENISLKNIFYDLKKDIIKNNGYPKEFGKRPLSFHQNLSFSKTFSTRTKSLRPDSSRLFIPGCSPSAYSPNIVSNVYAYLNDKSPTHFFKKCCGNPTLSVGNTKKFEHFTRPLKKEVQALNPSEIVVLCMNCYKTFKKLFPNIPVFTIWEVVLRDGLPLDIKDIQSLSKKWPAFTLHDPCPTRNHRVIHEAVRLVISKLEIEIHEYKHNRENTTCCGSGAMLSLIHSDLSEKQKSKRASQADTDHILTYCQECAESLSRSNKKAIHLLDLVFGDLSDTDHTGPYEQNHHNTIKKWVNRRIVKTHSDKLNSK